MLCRLVALALVLVAVAPAAAAPPTRTVRPTVVIEPPQSGFRWSDAAVGAAAAVGLVLVAAGVVVVLRSRQPESKESP